jgi:hypothetical protein
MPVTLCTIILLLTNTRMKKASKKVPEIREPVCVQNIIDSAILCALRLARRAGSMLRKEKK